MWVLYCSRQGVFQLRLPNCLPFAVSHSNPPLSVFVRSCPLSSKGCILEHSVFLTNHPLHVANNTQALGYVLGQIAAALTYADLPSSVDAWVRRIALEAGHSEAFAFRALKKATASNELPKLHDSSMRLIDALTGCWEGGSALLAQVDSSRSSSTGGRLRPGFVARSPTGCPRLYPSHSSTRSRSLCLHQWQEDDGGPSTRGSL
jgi:hypothetical protein